MSILSVISTGWAILLAALVLNVVAAKLKLTTWYDFVKRRDQQDVSLVSYVWLLLIYPACLGAIAVAILL